MIKSLVRTGLLAALAWCAACSGGKGGPTSPESSGSSGASGANTAQAGASFGGKSGASGNAAAGKGGFGAGGGAGQGTTIPLAWTQLKPKIEMTDGTLMSAGSFGSLFVTSADTVLGTHWGIGPSGLFRSTNRGATWVQVSTASGTPGVGASVVAEKGGKLIAVGRLDLTARVGNGAPNGVCVSTDDGATWSAVSSLDADVNDVLVASPTHWFAATAKGVKETSDGGVSWATVGPDIGSVTTLILDANGTLHAQLPERLARTRLLNPFWFVYADSFTKSNPTQVWSMADGSLVGRLGAGLGRSLDFGDTWNVPAGGRAVATLIELRSGAHLGMTGKKLGYSHDFGYTWTDVAFNYNNSPESIAQFSDDSLLLGTDGDPGSLLLSEPFESEAPVSTAPVAKRPASCFDGQLSAGETRVDCGAECGVCQDWATYGALAGHGIYVSKAGTWFSGLQNDSLAYSKDAGLTWIDTGKVTPLPVAEYGETLYALSSPGPVLVSSNAGLAWSPLDTQQQTVGATSDLVVSSTGTLYISFPSGLFASNGSGWTDLSWSTATMGSQLVLGPDDRPIALDSFSVGHLNAAGTAFERYTPVPYRDFTVLGSVGDTVYLVSSGTLFTTDASFTSLTEVGPVPADTDQFLAVAGGPLIVVTQDSGLPYLSKDGGKTWESRGQGFTHCQAHPGDFAFTDDGRLVVACYIELRVSRPVSEW